MENKELVVENLTKQCRNLDRKYELLRSDYERVKDVYADNPTFTNYRKLHAIHSKLIRCSDELCDFQSRLIDAYWAYFGIRHWQFRLRKDKKKLLPA